MILDSSNQVVYMDLPGTSFFGQSHSPWGQMEKPLWSDEAQRDVVGRGAGAGEHKHRCLGRWWIRCLWRVHKLAWMRLWKTLSFSKALLGSVTPPGARRQGQSSSEHPGSHCMGCSSKRPQAEMLKAPLGHLRWLW